MQPARSFKIKSVIYFEIEASGVCPEAKDDTGRRRLHKKKPLENKKELLGVIAAVLVFLGSLTAFFTAILGLWKQ